MIGSCKGCRWYDEDFGVCCNGDSDYCADYPPETDSFSCGQFEGKQK